MLKLKELRFKGIGRFVDLQTVNFESLGSLVQVDGSNLNTGGSSGSGKSTLFNSLDYLLGFSDIPNTVLKSRYSDEGIFVEGVFDFDGKPLTITRGKKLSIDLDGEITTGSSSIAEAKLDEILGIPRDLFRPMLHKRQKEGGFFLNMTPREMNDFLTSCLGLTAYRSKIDLLDKKAKDLASSVLTYVNSSSAALSGLTATQSAIASLGETPEKDVDQATVLLLKAKADKSIAELTNLKLAHKLEVESLEISRPKLEVESLEISRPKIEEVPFNTSTKDAYESSLKNVSSSKSQAQLLERSRQANINELISAKKMEIEKLSQQIKAADRAKTDAANIAIEIKKIRENACPTCEQTWNTDSAKATEASHMAKLMALKEAIVAGALASEQTVSSTVDLNNLNKEVQPLVPEGLQDLEVKEKELIALILAEKQKELSHRNEQQLLNRAKLDEFASKQKLQRDEQQLLNRTKLDEFASKQKLQRDAHSQALSLVAGQADIDSNSFHMAQNRLKSQDEALTRHNSSLASLRAQEASYNGKIYESTDLKNAAEAELAMVEELKRAVKSYLSCSFDEALAVIGDNATKLIRNIPNMANATLSFEGTKETKDGKVKEEVNCVINMDGEDGIDIRSLSGGERTATDLAIDLSVVDLIEARANKGIDLFILDEPFNALDSINVEMAIEILKNSNTSKRLILVDHNPEIKQMMESKLTVVREGSISNIVQS